MEVCTAREWIRVGTALHDLPYVDAAFDSGLSYSKIRALTRVATRANERELLELAYDTTAASLGPVLARWLGNHEDPAETRARQRAARAVAHWTEPDGMIHGTFRLPAAEGKRLTAAIDTRVRRAHLHGAPGDASADASPLRWPSVAQQRADALVELVTGGGTRIVTEVVMHVRGDGAAFDDGTPIPWPEIEHVLPESFVRALIHDADRRPIDASSRRRHPSARQKAVVRERHPGCVDCGSTELLEFDHDPPYEHTRRTIVDEIVPRCWPCHRKRHGDDRRRRRSRRE
jgi:hypothetical protein